MNKINNVFEAFRQRMIEAGRVITLPKDSPLRAMLGMDEPEDTEEAPQQEEVESTNTQEE